MLAPGCQVVQCDFITSTIRQSLLTLQPTLETRVITLPTARLILTSSAGSAIDQRMNAIEKSASLREKTKASDSS